MTIKYKWEPGIRLEKGGHRIFHEIRHAFAAPETCRWAIADNSGTTPDRTEDGVLWLDFSRPLRVNLGGGCIPVLAELDGERESHCPCGIDAVAALHEKFPKWKVLPDGITMKLLSVFGLPPAPEPFVGSRTVYVVSAMQEGEDGDQEPTMTFTEDEDVARAHLHEAIDGHHDIPQFKARVTLVTIPAGVTEADKWLWSHSELWTAG
jgi:hypothetical protein